MADQMQEIVEMLPADGSEVDYTAWRQQVIGTGNMRLVSMIHQARRRKLVLFRVETDDAGNITKHVVKRATPGVAS